MPGVVYTESVSKKGEIKMEWTLDQMPLGQEAVVLQIEENSMLGRRMR